MARVNEFGEVKDRGKPGTIAMIDSLTVCYPVRDANIDGVAFTCGR